MATLSSAVRGQRLHPAGKQTAQHPITERSRPGWIDLQHLLGTR
jgi:hypothetical protein